MKPKGFKVGDGVYLSTKYLQSTQQLKKLDPKYVGPFPIVIVINSVSVQLELPKNLRCIHCSLLKPETVLPLLPAPNSPPMPILIEGEQHFKVKKILDSRKQRGRVQYLVTWKHFPPSKSEWADATHVQAPKLLQTFHKKYPDKS